MSERDELPPGDALGAIELIADDAYAVSFQSMGQYRSTVLGILRDRAKSTSPTKEAQQVPGIVVGMNLSHKSGCDYYIWGKAQDCTCKYVDEKPARPRGKPCTCDNCLGSSCACRVDAGEKLGELWYCQKRAAAETSACPCWDCSSPQRRMTTFIVCPDCGNKRCPKATNHTNACTGSNEPGQLGSRFTPPGVSESENDG